VAQLPKFHNVSKKLKEDPGPYRRKESLFSYDAVGLLLLKLNTLPREWTSLREDPSIAFSVTLLGGLPRGGVFSILAILLVENKQKWNATQKILEMVRSCGDTSSIFWERWRFADLW